MGLTPAGWRFIHRYGNRAYRGVIHNSLSQEQNLLNTLCFVDWQVRGGLEEPLPEILGMNYLLSMGMSLEFEHQIDPRLAYMVARHWEALHTDDLRESFAECDWVQMIIWLRDHTPRLDRNQWCAGWTALQRQYELWRKLRQSEARWESPLEEISLGSWRIVPLISSYDVALEGVRMKHCVATYAATCLLGEYRLFSVRSAENDHPLATVGLEKQDGVWALEQVKGKCNEIVCGEIQGVAEEIGRRFRRAVSSHEHKNLVGSSAKRDMI